MKKNILILFIFVLLSINTVLTYIYINSNILQVRKTVVEPRQFKINTLVETFNQTSPTSSQTIETKNSTTSADLDYSDLLLLQNKQKEVQAKMTLLVIDTNIKTAITNNPIILLKKPVLIFISP